MLKLRPLINNSKRFISYTPILYKHEVQIINSDAAPEYKLGLPRY